MASTTPSPAFGVPVASPDCTARAAARASAGSDLPYPAPRTAVGPVHLDDDQPLGVQPAGQPGTPTAGALDPEPVDDPERRRPREQPPIAARGGLHRDRAKVTAELIERNPSMGVGMGVDPDGDQQLGVVAWWSCPLLSCDVRAPTGRGRRTRLRRDSRIAVGTALAGGPPHRSQRALLTHWAPPSGTTVKSLVGPGMSDAGLWYPGLSDGCHTCPVEACALASAPKRPIPEPYHLEPEPPHRMDVGRHG
jgi:hypothetical protein